ncbi:MAG: sensor histidine kinase, partial [Gaiellaceae bacterium]
MRWRLAAVSAVLTFLILVTFALVVGRLTSSRIQHDFDTELADAAESIAAQVPAASQSFNSVPIKVPDLEAMVGPGPPGLVVRVVSADGGVFREAPRNAPNLGPPSQPFTRTGDLETANVLVGAGFGLYVQYARSIEPTDATVNKLWLFLAAGVLGGTLLAAFVGVAVAGRAMRPIAALTATARGIAATRDPSRRVPAPTTDDEVAELALTLDQMLRELDAARTETDQMIQAQREFVADASHELRTPLTSILANLELLQARLDETERQGEEGEIIDGALRSSRRMGRLVSDLLLLARADAGRTSTRTLCDLTEVAEGALAEVRPVAGDRTFDLDAATGVPVMGSPDELHRLVLNLLENAVRHTPAGTEVQVRVGRRDGRAVLAVADDGPGIPEGMDEQIFARFVRGSGPADLAPDGGTGLGLAIVAAVAG